MTKLADEVLVSEVRGVVGHSDASDVEWAALFGVELGRDWRGRATISHRDAARIFEESLREQNAGRELLESYDAYAAGYEEALGVASRTAAALIRAHVVQQEREYMDGRRFRLITLTRAGSTTGTQHWKGSPQVARQARRAFSAADEAFRMANPAPLAFADWEQQGRPGSVLKDRRKAIVSAVAEATGMSNRGVEQHLKEKGITING